MNLLEINLINRLIYLAFIIVLGCSSPKYKNIEPNEYTFENEYIQSKWSYFLSLDDCSKVEHLDSIFRPILVEQLRTWNKPNLGEVLIIDTNLITGHPIPIENYYYWIFREVQSITNRGPNVWQQHYGYMGISNIQFHPAYFEGDSLKVFDSDIRAWKDSLGCK